MSVWQRQRNWWSEVLWKPKKSLSIEQLKYQYQILQRNPHVTENNKQTIVETFRSIAEILIWGDQNDSRVFDFFLEKNMQSFFLKILTQRCGRYVCLQLLQTLNILFENIRNETSIYYLLSNNHVNSIIVLKLDFSDEEVLAYYISFLKTLSFKLNKHTIHFFYNEHLRDFPLYTEAIKFFNHSESMVRIAVRTLTLNVYKVDDPAMLEYIHNKTAVPYFSNLVWFIGNHVIELDECLISQAHHLNRGRLEQLVAEHLDHLHYISDILSLKVQSLNDVIIDHLLNRLLIPLYVYSLTDQTFDSEQEQQSRGDSPRISSTVSLFMLSQVFLIVKCPEVVTPLAYLILTGDTTLSLPPVLQDTPPSRHRRDGSYTGVRGFLRPEATLEKSFAPKAKERKRKSKPVNVLDRIKISEDSGGSSQEGSSTESQRHMTEAGVGGAEGGRFSETRKRSSSSLGDFVDVSIVDSQYVLIEASSGSSRTSSILEQSDTPPTAAAGHTHPEPPPPSSEPLPDSEQPRPKTPPTATPKSLSPHHNIPVTSTVFLDVLMNALSVRNDDSRCLFTLCLLLAMIDNEGVHPKLLEAFSLKPQPPEESGVPQYNSELVILLLSTLDTSTAASSCIRLVTLRLATMLLKNLLGTHSTSPLLQDHHIALIENIYESAILRLRLYYKGAHDEFFLDMFEEQFKHEQSFQVKIPYLMMDASMLLPPTDTPLTGIDFTRRLPCGENEKAMNAMRVFFAIRTLSQQLQNSEETELPLTPPSNSAQPDDVLDFNNCNLVSCTVLSGEKKSQHFMVVTETEFLLVTPDKAKLGWGVVHFISFLQDVDVTFDPADNCSLYVVCSKDSTHKLSTHKRPALSARFQFDDHIRCVSARQLLLRSKDHLRLAKMTRITKMLHLPVPEASPTSSMAALPRPQYDPLGVVSLDSMSRTAGRSPSTAQPVELTSSMVHNVFLPPSATPLNPQEIEMSNFKFDRSSHLHSLAEADAPILFDSPVKLAPPMAPPTDGYSSEGSGHSLSESSLNNVHIGADSLLVHYDKSGKSRTPETLLEGSFGSRTDEQLSELSTSTEQPLTPTCPSEGYRVEAVGSERDGTPAGQSDSSTAEEDREVSVTQLATPVEKDEQAGKCLELDKASPNDFASSKPLVPTEYALEDQEDAPEQITCSHTSDRNVSVTVTHPLLTFGGDVPVLSHHLAVGSSAHPLSLSNNIVWDVPLIEELNEEEKCRTAGALSEHERHSSHD